VCAQENETGDKTFSYKVDPATGCWVWTGTYHHGYPVVIERRVAASAAARVWRRVKGKAVPHNSTLKAECGNTCCVNPDHRKMMNRKYAARKIDPGTARKLLNMLATRQITQVEAASQLGVTQGAISMAVRKISRKDSK
jgi:hypothetical protein